VDLGPALLSSREAYIDSLWNGMQAKVVMGGASSSELQLMQVTWFVYSGEELPT
jgi:hypothetical protein